MNQKINVVVPSQEIYNSYLNSYDFNTNQIVSNIITFSNEELANEEWRCIADIPEYYRNYIKSKRDQLLFSMKDNFCRDYFISSLGRICKYDKLQSSYILCKVYMDPDYYLYIPLYIKQYSLGNLKWFKDVLYLHRLVAYLFKPLNDDPINKNNVNHINEIRSFNKYYNLEWISLDENILYGTSLLKRMTYHINDDEINKIHNTIIDFRENIEYDFSILDLVNEENYPNIQNQINFIQPEEVLKSYEINNFTSEELKNEEWKCVNEIDTFYLPYFRNKKYLQLFNIDDIYVSNLGRIAEKINNNLILKTATVRDPGNYRSTFFHGIKTDIHVLVAYLFLPLNDDPEHKIFVNHKNEFETYNNRVTNLEWITPKDNNNYGTKNKRTSFSVSKSNLSKESKTLSEDTKNKIKNNYDNSQLIKKNKRKIIRINIYTEEKVEYNSLTDAAKDNNCTFSTIRNCCTGRQDLFKREFRFQYSDLNGPKKINQPIVQLTETGEVVKIYNNLTTVMKENPSFSRHQILSCCIHPEKHYASNGYGWRYVSDYNNELHEKGLPPLDYTFNEKEIRKPIKNLTNAVVSVDINNNIIKTYLTSAQVEEDNYKRNTIYGRCTRYQQTHKKIFYDGICWMFLKDYKSN